MIEITSFGYLHAPAPEAHLTIDLRAHFRDPHVDPAMREMTAYDQEVVHAVMTTPGVAALICVLADAARQYVAAPAAPDLRIAIGCAGGRHRSAVIAARLTRILEAGGHNVVLNHRDIDKPVVKRTAVA